MLTLGRGGGAGVLCSRVLRRSEPLVCFQINNDCVSSAHHIYCDLTKEPRNNIAQQKGKKRADGSPEGTKDTSTDGAHKEALLRGVQDPAGERDHG